MVKAGERYSTRRFYIQNKQKGDTWGQFRLIRNGLKNTWNFVEPMKPVESLFSVDKF
jgi:hypothetical protein